MKKIMIPIIILITIGIIVFIVFINEKNKISKNEKNSNNNIEERENMRMEDQIKLNVNNKELIIELEDNSSSKALLEKLKENDLEIKTHDYGNFEKVGDLGFDLPTNDQKITTKPGDLILYQGNKITLYYDTNTWTFTKLGKINNISQEELKEILGDGDVTLKFSVMYK